MANKPIPSVNPADLRSMVGLFRFIQKKFSQRTDDMLPGIVLEYNRETNRAKVQIMIMVVKTNGEAVARAPIASIPVRQYGGGGMILSFNMKPGDLGWVKANDRDISLFLQKYKQSNPNTWRIHNFSDAVFEPDPMTGYVIAEEDGENAVLQTLDGSQRISIWDDKIKITSDSEVIVDAPLATFTGDVHIEGDLTVDGDISATNVHAAGTVRADVDVIAGTAPHTVSLVHHVHSGVTSGGSNTGEPVS